MSISVKKEFDVSKGVLLADKYSHNQDPKGLLMSEKLDGIRAIWTGSKLLSRNNKPIHAPEFFLKGFPKGDALDGELFVGRQRFENTGFVKKKKPINSEWAEVKFYVYDAPQHKGTFEERLKFIKNIITKSKSSSLVYVKHTIVKNYSHMMKQFNDIVSKGGEGIMLRVPTSPYVQKRSKFLLKVKPTDDAEGKVVGKIEGTGKMKGMLGAIQMQLVSDPSIKFKIGTGFSVAERKQIWSNSKFIGKLITFTFKGLTKYGVPRFPSFLRKANTF
jgi:DNA ligase-1